MEDAQILSFVLWSAITGAVLLVASFSYREYLALRHRNAGRT